jgi:hypothetical protein
MDDLDAVPGIWDLDRAEEDKKRPSRPQSPNLDQGDDDVIVLSDHHPLNAPARRRTGGSSSSNNPSPSSLDWIAIKRKMMQLWTTKCDKAWYARRRRLQAAAAAATAAGSQATPMETKESPAEEPILEPEEPDEPLDAKENTEKEQWMQRETKNGEFWIRHIVEAHRRIYEMYQQCLDQGACVYVSGMFMVILSQTLSAHNWPSTRPKDTSGPFLSTWSRHLACRVIVPSFVNNWHRAIIICAWAR